MRDSSATRWTSAYRESNGRRFARVDGEIKTWELERCLREAFPSDKDPVRANVEFFVKIRNKVEHRYEQTPRDRARRKDSGTHPQL
jgi:hypothetical protein